jgi:hypothetical protein
VSLYSHIPFYRQSVRLAGLASAWLLAGVLCADASGQNLVLTSHFPILYVQLDASQQSAVSQDTKLLFKRQNVPTKITVQSVSPSQSFGLTVTATGLTAGTSTGTVLLQDGMPPVDLIVNVPTGNRMEQTNLRYVATATVQQGNSDEEGFDTHLVTYTLVQQ